MSKNDFEYVSGNCYYGIIFTLTMATGVVQYNYNIRTIYGLAILRKIRFAVFELWPHKIEHIGKIFPCI